MTHKPELQLFEYVVYTQDKLDKDGEVTEKGSVIVPRTEVLLPSAAQVEMVASRAIPEKYMDELDRVRVVVRPF